ncbi:MAG: carbohydrate-binding protein [Sporocytophaga sp.]|uniref:carbohydrate-binding protein n=1 Tax=Sporocytophaga sp. TaxID=2231183 RepID=UPI001B0F26A1|nr:carbohydrate-binding protein [Sporocytophaga sp.]MBO9703474.1 carbohydrate-binding protein [Sporocytophaga sp.]
MKTTTTKFFMLAFGAMLVVCFAVQGQQTLKVDLSKTIRPVTHCASGSLYGVTETLPADIVNLVAPLKPHVFANPALSGAGRQQPIGDALKVSERLQSTTGKVQIRLPDVLPGWPYQWPGTQNYLNTCTQVINGKKASKRTNYDGYEIWNEPPGTWNTANGNFNSTCWKPTFDLIRSLDPGARIIGPSLAYYNNTQMRDFLTYCKANNCIPDVICWHQWGAGGFVSAYNQYRALEKELGISARPISINEYSSKTSDPNEGCPGYSVPFISKFERHGIESACISWWFTNLPGRLGSLLTSGNQKGGGWHLYKWYGDMTGNMIQVTPPNDMSEGLDGFGCIDDVNKYASICLGGNFTGNATVNISGIPSYFGSSVKVKLEYVTWSNKDTPVTGTTLISNSVYSVNNGSVSVPVNVASIYYAYRIYVEPSVSTSTVTIAVPTKDTVVSNPSNVVVRANVSDPTAITNLKFFVNGVQFGSTLTSAPFTATLAVTKAGTYTVTAEITDKSNSKIVSTSRTIRTAVAQTGYNYQSHPIPGTIQFEEYDLGGNGFAYLDNTPGSSVTPVVNFRTDEDVDIENCTDTGEGYNVGYATAGEWLEYTVNVAKAGLYNLDLRLACNGDGRTLGLSLDGTVLSSTISIPNTAGWQTWQYVSLKNIQLPAGEHVLRVTIGAVDYINLNYMVFTSVAEPPTITLTTPINQSIYTVGNSIVMNANASDADGNIVGVTFYANGILLATDNTAPYTYTWEGMLPGTYTIYAEAFDTDNLSAKSTTNTVIIKGRQEPYKGKVHLIPGRINAEEYDLGGEGLAYHEANTNGNEGKATLRNDEVDIEATQDVEGIYNVGYILKDEWLEYTVNVVAQGNYDLDVRLAADGEGKTLHIEMDGVNVTGQINVPNTGGWQTWQTVTLNNISLAGGEHIMRIAFDSDYMNLNYVEFKDVITGIDENESSAIAVYPNPFTDAGLQINNVEDFNYKITDISGMLIESGNGRGGYNVGKNLSDGLYFLIVENNSDVTVYKIVKKINP